MKKHRSCCDCEQPINRGLVCAPCTHLSLTRAAILDFHDSPENTQAFIETCRKHHTPLSLADWASNQGAERLRHFARKLHFTLKHAIGTNAIPTLWARATEAAAERTKQHHEHPNNT